MNEKVNSHSHKTFEFVIVGKNMLILYLLQNTKWPKRSLCYVESTNYSVYEKVALETFRD